MEEHVELDSDRRSLRCRQPVASAGSVRLLVNDEVFIPQGGLYTPAKIISAKSGPFDILPNEDILTVRTPSGTFTHTFGVRARTTLRLTADEIIKLLLRGGLVVAEATSDRGHLAFEDFSTVGSDSFVEVSGSAARALGFGVAGVITPSTSDTDREAYSRQRRAQGASLYPGWQLVTPSDEITSRFPKFLYPIRSNPVFKMTYAVPGQRCLRCGSSYVENDIRFDSTGQMITIRDENLLYQAALKILLTARGSNPYHLWYGSDIQSRVGGKAIPGVAALLSEDVRKALTRLQKLQTEQAKYQTVSLKERLYTIQSVRVRQHEQDVTAFLVDVVVSNASGAPIELSIVFTVPSVVALMGSNGLVLGAEAAGLLPNQTPPPILTGRG